MLQRNTLNPAPTQQSNPSRTPPQPDCDTLGRMSLAALLYHILAGDYLPV